MRTRHTKKVFGLAAIAVATCVALCVVGCGGETAKPPTPAAAPQQQAQKPAAAQKPAIPQVPPENAVTIWDEKAFDSKLLRDPFKPFIRVEPKGKDKAKLKPVPFVPKTPLQKFALEELKYVGALWSKDKAAEGLIEDPAGKGYRVGVGTFIGNRGAKIISILPGKIVVEERMLDVLGEENINLITLLLHKPENEVNP